LIERCARERQAGDFADERYPQHLARIKARQAELFGSNAEAADRLDAALDEFKRDCANIAGASLGVELRRAS